MHPQNKVQGYPLFLVLAVGTLPNGWSNAPKPLKHRWTALALALNLPPPKP